MIELIRALSLAIADGLGERAGRRAQYLNSMVVLVAHGNSFSIRHHGRKTRSRKLLRSYAEAADGFQSNA